MNRLVLTMIATCALAADVELPGGSTRFDYRIMRPELAAATSPSGAGTSE
jgi:hypothetical protein